MSSIPFFGVWRVFEKVTLSKILGRKISKLAAGEAFSGLTQAKINGFQGFKCGTLPDFSNSAAHLRSSLRDSFPSICQVVSKYHWPALLIIDDIWQ